MITIREDFKRLIPPLSADEYRQLEENILNDGIREPLVLWGETLMDGHNRYEIAQKHSLPFETVQKEFTNDDEAKIWIIDNQFGRRNLPITERIILAQKKSAVIAERARARQQEAGGDRKSTKYRENASVKNDKSDQIPISTRDEVAKMAGVSSGTVAQFEQIQKKKPELIENIRKGEITIGRAYGEVRREEKKAMTEKRIEEHAKEQTGTVDILNSDREYNIIYADPPWKYWDSGDKNQSLYYPTMSIDEICNLPIGDIAADDCILFLWVTYPILKEAFRVIDAWGFKYSTAGFIWVKKNPKSDTPFVGLGSWTRANSELCLIATKGNVMRMDASISQVVESPIEEHSKKPDVVRDLITQLVGKLPRIELFCRNPAEGWDAWGNEA